MFKSLTLYSFSVDIINIDLLLILCGENVINVFVLLDILSGNSIY